MNWKRIVVGGLAAGVVMNVVNVVLTMALLMERYERYGEQGLFLKDPRLPFMPLWVLVLLAMGIGLAFLYAAARPRLGAGPKTALLVGLVVGFAWGVPSNLGAASWGMMGRYLPFVWCVSAFVESIVGALVAGALYKEAS